MIDQYSSLGEKFLKKGFWLYLFSFIIAPIGYIVKIIISGELSVEEVGILYGVISLITLLAGFNDFGMTESMNKFIPQFIKEKKYSQVKMILVITLLTQMITGGIIFCIFFFGSHYMALYFFKSESAIEVLKIFSFFFIGANLFQIISTFLMSVQNTFLNKVLELCRMSSVLIFTLIVFFTDNSNIIIFSYGWLFGLLIGIIISYTIFYLKYYKIYLKGVPVDYNKQVIKNIFSYAITIFLGLQAATILGQIDMQMILYFLGSSDAGYYTVYLSIIGIPFMLLGPIFSFLFPVISELKASENIKNISLLKKTFQKIFILSAIIVSIFFFIFAKEILFVLFGEKFIPAAFILKFSIFFLVFNFLLQINFNIMSGVGYVKERVYIICAAIFFNIIMNFILIQILGVGGAALATGFGWTLIWIISEYVLRKDFPLKLEYINIFKNIFVLGLIGYIYTSYLPIITMDGGRLITLLFLILYFGVFASLFFIINWNEVKLFSGEISKLMRSR